MINPTNPYSPVPSSTEASKTQADAQEKAQPSIKKAIIPIHILQKLHQGDESVAANDKKTDENREQSKKFIEKRKRTYFPTGEYTFERKPTS